jgi:zinc protease
LPLTPTPDAEFRSEPPYIAPGPLLHAPKLGIEDLPNGLRLIVAEDPQQAVVSVAFAGRDARAAGLDADNTTLAQLALVTMSKSADGESGSLETDDDAEPGALVTSWRASKSGSYLAVSALADDVERSVERLARMLTAPQLSDSALKRAKATLAAPRIQREQLGAPRLEAEAEALLYGPQHPAARLPSDTSSLLLRISLEHVRAFHARHYVPQHSALILAGPISLERARELAQRTLGTWQGTGPAFPPVTLPATKPGKRVLRLDRSTRYTDHLVAALPCVPSSSPDHLALEVLATLLGRVVGSELARQLRHDTGQSYSWSAECVDNPWYGTFYLRLETDRGKAAEVLSTALAELERLSREPLTARELEAARMTYLAQQASRLTSSRGVAHALAQGFLSNREPDFLGTLEARVNALTADQLRAVAQRYFHAAPIAVVASGQYLELKGTLAPFGNSAGN